MNTITTDLYTDIAFTLSNCEQYKTVFDLLTTTAYVNHIGRNVVQIAFRAAKQQSPDRIDTYGAGVLIENEKIWLKNSLKHRNWDLPAIITNTTKMWLKNGIQHRNANKPSFISMSGALTWTRNGIWHRDGDKPAIINDDFMEWFKNGKRHRNGDKPSVVYRCGIREWWKNGVQYTPH